MSTLIKKSDEMFPAFVTRFFDDLFPETSFQGNKISLPAVNISESDKAFHLELKAPGFKKEDFKVVVEENVLSISGFFKKEEEEKKKNYTRKEYSSSSFKRQFSLPDNVNQDSVHATYQDGILLVELPKKELENATLVKEINVN